MTHFKIQFGALAFILHISCLMVYAWYKLGFTPFTHYQCWSWCQIRLSWVLDWTSTLVRSKGHVTHNLSHVIHEIALCFLGIYSSIEIWDTCHRQITMWTVSSASCDKQWAIWSCKPTTMNHELWPLALSQTCQLPFKKLWGVLYSILSLHSCIRIGKFLWHVHMISFSNLIGTARFRCWKSMALIVNATRLYPRSPHILRREPGT